MNDATASACRELIANGRGENHNATGTATVRTPPIALRVAGPLRTSTIGAARTVCSVVPTTELVLQPFPFVPTEADSCAFTLIADPNSELDFLAGRIVAPESSKLHSS